LVNEIFLIKIFIQIRPPINSVQNKHIQKYLYELFLKDRQKHSYKIFQQVSLVKIRKTLHTWYMKSGFRRRLYADFKVTYLSRYLK
jgi:hypothetical protein